MAWGPTSALLCQRRGSGHEPTGRLPAEPCPHPAGSLGRLRTFEQRAVRGEDLFHPDDSLRIDAAPKAAVKAWIHESTVASGYAQRERARKRLRKDRLAAANPGQVRSRSGGGACDDATGSRA
jgi:hypothetical protein